MKTKKCIVCGDGITSVQAKYCPICKQGIHRMHKNTSAKVRTAISNGKLKHPSKLKCVDCGKKAECYDHRDYAKPLDVAPVCSPCNVRRGPAIGFGKLGVTRQRVQQIAGKKP